MSQYDADPEGQAKRVAEDLAALKQDVAGLIREMRGFAARFGEEAADTISDRAAEMYETASDAAREKADALSARVEAQPLTSLLLAFGAGFILSKLLTR